MQSMQASAHHRPSRGAQARVPTQERSMRTIATAAFVASALAGTAHGQELRADMYLITPEAMNKPIGLVLISSTDAGAKFVPDLQGLPPGQHGFHVHEHG